MKIIDLKNVDVKRCKRFYKYLNLQLQECNSFVGQRNILLNKYNEDSFQRDFLIRRKLQLERIFKYNYDKTITISMSIFLPIVGSYLTYLNDKGLLLTLLFLAIACWNIFALARDIQKKTLDDVIPLYEIRDFELSLINDLLSQGIEEVNLFDFVQQKNK